jgi:hypothetical protein
MDWWKGAYNGWVGKRGLTTVGMVEWGLTTDGTFGREIKTDGMC